MRSRQQLAAMAAAMTVCVGAIALLFVATSGRSSAVVLMADPDAPTSQEISFAHAQSLRSDSKAQLRHKVQSLEHEVKVLKTGKRLPAKKMSLMSRPASGESGDMSQRMMWAEEAMKGVHLDQPSSAQPQMHVAKSRGTQQLAVPYPGSSVWYNVVSNGDNAQALTTKAGDDNPIAGLVPGDYWKDPSERPFLHAPGPHDPASTLAKTVTGDYASPATWGDIYHSKETIDWCVENFDYFTDRVKCIRKMHGQGPLLG